MILKKFRVSFEIKILSLEVLMKKNIVIFIIFSLFVCAAFPQVSVNPNEEFYSDAAGWYLKGYVERLPQIKPYPVAVIEEILIDVIKKGEPSEQAKAEFYYEKYFAKEWHVSLDSSAYARIYSIADSDAKDVDHYDDALQLSVEPEFSYDFSFGEYFSSGLIVGLRGQSSYVNSSEVLPKFTYNSELDVIAPFEFNADSIDFLLDVNGNFTVGSKDVYATVGFTPLGYGLFPNDDIILSPDGNQILHGSFNYEGKYFQYAQIFGVVGAMNKSFLEADDYSFSKFFAFHSTNVPLFNGKLNLSYFEGAVFGNGFQPAMLTPVPWAIVSLADGRSETLYAGLKVEVKPVPCFSWNTEFLLNDLKPKNFIKLKWNDAAIRGAFKTGFVYSPLDSIASLITVDYTMVTPEIYSCYDSFNDDYNYRDYSNFGTSIGSNLLPNSDRVSVKINFKPSKNLKITTTTLYSRHGNSYEDLDYDEIVKLNGSQYSYSSIGQNSNGFESLTSQTNFLMQDDLMYSMQAGLDIQYTLFSKKSSNITFSVGYTFEFIQNDGVDQAIYPGDYSNYKTYLDTINSETATDAQKQDAKSKFDSIKEAWKDRLHDSYNHYFRAGVKINF